MERFAFEVPLSPRRRCAFPGKMMHDRVLWPRRMIVWAAILFFVGLAVRLLLLHIQPDTLPKLQYEPVNIAISLATTGRYADAYGAGVGPTAHCAPLHPLLLSVLIRNFGIHKAGVLAADVAASIASSLAFALLPLFAVASGLKPVPGVLAGAAGALLPINFFHQTSGVFDAPFTTAVLVGLCILMCHIWMRAIFTMREGAILGTAAGLGALLNPVILAVIAAWLTIIAVEYRRRARQALIFCGVSAACLILTLTPWAIRNLRVLGSLIWTRSNFWLEMQVSNNDLLTANEERNASMPQFPLVHPYTGAIQRAKVKKLGEVAYMRSKRQEAIAWISSHKRRFLALSAERFRLFWLPTMARVWQTLFEAVLTLLGLGGLALLFRQRVTSAYLFAGILIAYPAVYYVIQVSPRYRLPIEPILFLLAANLCCTFAPTLLVQFRNAHRVRTAEVIS